MKIISKSAASKLQNKHSYKKSRLDRGKYKWTGSSKDYVGMEVPDFKGVVAVYPERRSDRYGTYCALMSLHK